MSGVGTGRHGSTGVMTAREAFVANQRKLAGKEASPKLVCIDLQPYQTVQACERAGIMNIGGFSDSLRLNPWRPSRCSSPNPDIASSLADSMLSSKNVIRVGRNVDSVTSEHIWYRPSN